MKQIDIKELIPFMRDGWVAMNGNGIWYWFAEKPVLEEYIWDCNCYYIIDISDIFNIKPAKDWTKSLMKVGGK